MLWKKTKRIKTCMDGKGILSFKESLQEFLSLSRNLFKNAHLGFLKERKNPNNNKNPHSSWVKKIRLCMSFVFTKIAEIEWLFLTWKAHFFLVLQNGRSTLVVHVSTSRKALTSYNGHRRVHCWTVMWEMATVQLFPVSTETNIQVQLSIIL